MIIIIIRLNAVLKNLVILSRQTFSCLGGRLLLFDGTHEPGNHRFPPNTYCGRYDGGTNGSVFTSGHVAEVELSGEPETVGDDDMWSFAMSFKYVNMG